MKKVLKVDGMTCGHCEKAVKEALNELAEVTSVSVDLGEKKVEVEGNNLDDKVLKDLIDEAGYQVLSID